jgi:hypothetical protein
MPAAPCLDREMLTQHRVHGGLRSFGMSNRSASFRRSSGVTSTPSSESCNSMRPPDHPPAVQPAAGPSHRWTTRWPVALGRSGTVPPAQCGRAGDPSAQMARAIATRYDTHDQVRHSVDDGGQLPHLAAGRLAALAPAEPSDRPWSSCPPSRPARRRSAVSGGDAGSSMGRGGGEPPVGAADQSPAAFMDRPMVGPAQQHQVVQIRRATIHPVPQMMGLTPGQGPVTGGEDTAAVTHGQGDPLAGLDDPAGPPHLQRLGPGHHPGPGAAAWPRSGAGRPGCPGRRGGGGHRGRRGCGSRWHAG